MSTRRAAVLTHDAYVRKVLSDQSDMDGFINPCSGGASGTSLAASSPGGGSFAGVHSARPNFYDTRVYITTANKNTRALDDGIVVTQYSDLVNGGQISAQPLDNIVRITIDSVTLPRAYRTGDADYLYHQHLFVHPLFVPLSQSVITNCGASFTHVMSTTTMSDDVVTFAAEDPTYVLTRPTSITDNLSLRMWVQDLAGMMVPYPVPANYVAVRFAMQGVTTILEIVDGTPITALAPVGATYSVIVRFDGITGVPDPALCAALTRPGGWSATTFNQSRFAIACDTSAALIAPDARMIAHIPKNSVNVLMRLVGTSTSRTNDIVATL